MHCSRLKKYVFTGLTVLFMTIAVEQLSAQSTGSSYRNAIGLGIDFGDGSTLVGISGKHFFTDNHVGQAEVLFGDHISFIQAFYEYHDEIEGAPGLRWYAGAGPGVALYRHGSAFLIRPIAGLDYKINNVPLSFSFDWRPWIWLSDGSDFEPARFGLGFRYTFNN